MLSATDIISGFLSIGWRIRPKFQDNICRPIQPMKKPELTVLSSSDFGFVSIQNQMSVEQESKRYKLWVCEFNSQLINLW